MSAPGGSGRGPVPPQVPSGAPGGQGNAGPARSRYYGRFQGQGGQGGRGRRSRRGNVHQQPPLKTSQFTSAEEGLKGFVYEESKNRNPAQFIKTTQEIIEYATKKQDQYNAKIWQGTINLNLQDLVPPTRPGNAMYVFLVQE